MTRAVCVKCGDVRSGFDEICPGCGHRPIGEGRLVAWLLSTESLDDAELDRVRARILAGESIQPTARMRDKARRALGQHLTTDLGMTTPQKVALLATSLLLTPLVGWVLFAWWWNVRPRSAIQALGLSLPATVAFTVLVLSLR